MNKKDKNFTIMTYYFPNFHPDKRNENIHGKGWTEWNLIMDAPSRFPNHYQPQKPIWGFENEADPSVMAKKIDCASNYGIDVFLFDYYHYNDGTFLNGALEQGFLKATNKNKIKFALMWANHDWYRIHGWKPQKNERPPLDFSGVVDKKSFEKICDYVIENYFTQDNYFLIDNAPYFSIYEIATLAKTFDSTYEMSKAIELFRNKCVKAGFSDLHLNAVYYGKPNLPGGRTKNWQDISKELKLNSFTSYTWIHHAPYSEIFPTREYEDLSKYYMEFWKNMPEENKEIYFPNITVGWDNSPRCSRDVEKWEGQPYVISSTIVNNTPEAFYNKLKQIKDELENNPKYPKVITINAWNEWPESSCLEPEERYGYGYLEAIKKLFS